MEAAGAEKVEVENLPPVHHKAWEAERLRALNEVLSVELQPEELLLERKNLVTMTLWSSTPAGGRAKRVASRGEAVSRGDGSAHRTQC